MNKEKALAIVDEAIEENARWIAFEIEKEGFEAPEVIINPNVNFEKQREWLDNTYDEQLVHKFASAHVQIKNIVSGQTFKGVQSKLFISNR